MEGFGIIYAYRRVMGPTCVRTDWWLAFRRHFCGCQKTL